MLGLLRGRILARPACASALLSRSSSLLSRSVPLEALALNNSKLPTAAAPAAAPEPEKTDLDKYLLLAKAPMDADVLKWWAARDHAKPADADSGRPEGLPRLAKMHSSNY